MTSVRHIPFYFPDTSGLIKYINGDGTPNIVLGGGIQNLITFYQMAKAGFIKDMLNNKAAAGAAAGAVGKFGDLSKFDIKTLTIEEGGTNMFAPYKVTINTAEVTREYIIDNSMDIVNTDTINGVTMGGKNTTRKGGRRRRKARGRKTPKRRVKKSKK